MSGSEAFYSVCAELERVTSLTGPQIRGAVRLSLKSAGLEAALVGTREMRAVAERVLPEKLRAQGVSESDLVTALDAIARALGSDEERERAGPASMFDRLDRARKTSG
ncbi:MAG: hypothetical protein AAF658_14980 [Myxococcota bacterium]